MSDSEEIVTNELGGKQSKLYRAYHLIDPYANEALGAILHRGAIKYDEENWRKIPIPEHLNHALHHINEAAKRYLEGRLNRFSLRPGNYNDPEDHLAHALCRIHFALAKEISEDGIHHEHSDPKYHEPKSTPIEPVPIRTDEGGLPPVCPTAGFREEPGNFAALDHSVKRNRDKRASQAASRTRLGARKGPVRRKR